jgi:hypothetical protein
MTGLRGTHLKVREVVERGQPNAYYYGELWANEKGKLQHVWHLYCVITKSMYIAGINIKFISTSTSTVVALAG